MDLSDIIIADDERVVRQSISSLLAANGYLVRSAKNGEEALRLYQEQRPDLMLLDVMMPKGDGYEVCETVRKTDVETPVLFLTALDSDQDELRGLDAQHRRSALARKTWRIGCRVEIRPRQRLRLASAVRTLGNSRRVDDNFDNRPGLLRVGSADHFHHVIFV